MLIVTTYLVDVWNVPVSHGDGFWYDILHLLCDETDDGRRASPHLVDILVVFRLKSPELIESCGIRDVYDVALDAFITKGEVCLGTGNQVSGCCSSNSSLGGRGARQVFRSWLVWRLG